MNREISDVGYFSKKILLREAETLSKIYAALFFSKKRVGLAKEADKLEEFVKDFLVVDSQLWLSDLRFCNEECDFLVRFPWRCIDHKFTLSLTDEVVILMSDESNEVDCKAIVDKLIDILWEEFCNSPVREKNIGPVPGEVLYLEKDGKKMIPDWYKEKAAFFHYLEHGGCAVSNWLKAVDDFLKKGFVFAK